MSQLNLFSGIDNLKFVEYHQKNPHIYNIFKGTATRAINKGFKKYSAKAIFEIIRWETASYKSPDEYKVNNNYTAFYARMFQNEYPEHKDFFRNRASKFDKLK